MDSKAYIASGDLEQYCLGLSDSAVPDRPEIRAEMKAIELALEQWARSLAVLPRPQIKKRILAALEDRIDLDNLPPTNQYSNFESWLKAVEHLIPAEPFEDFFAHLLQQNERIAQTLVVTKLNVPEEEHDSIAESFFILKGTCTCTVGKESFILNAGDHLNIPLHTPHDIRIDSPYVIAILQHQFG